MKNQWNISKYMTLQEIKYLTFKYKTINNIFTMNSFISMVYCNNIYCDYNKCSTLCQIGCKNFGKKYSCPPSSPSFEKISKNFKYLVINALKIPYDTLRAEYNSVRMANVVAKSLQRKLFDAASNDLKKENIKHIVLENGSCRLCKTCALQKNQPCKHPDKMRFSLEATGIDVNDLVIKAFGFPLQWYYKGKEKEFPKYQCVVSGILTNEPESVIQVLSANLDEFIQSLTFCQFIDRKF